MIIIAKGENNKKTCKSLPALPALPLHAHIKQLCFSGKHKKIITAKIITRPQQQNMI